MARIDRWIIFGAAIFWIVIAQLWGASEPSPIYRELAQKWLQYGDRPNAFLTTGYTVWVTVSLWVGSLAVTQSLLYLGLAGSLFAVVQSLGIRRFQSLIVVIAISHPRVWLGIVRVDDMLLSLVTLVIWGWLGVTLYRRPNRWRILLWVLVGAAMVWVRFNLLLVLAVGGMIWSLPNRRWLSGICSVGSSIILACLLNALVWGHFQLTPANGAYNFAAGNNLYSGAALDEYLNAEPSLFKLAELEPSVPVVHDPEHADVWREIGKQFWLQYPLVATQLLGKKLVVFFWPDTRQAGQGWKWLVAMGLALIAPIWMVLVIWFRLPRQEAMVLLALSAAYVVPFVLTNADPRFRLPLDLLFLVHLGTVVARIRRGKLSP